MSFGITFGSIGDLLAVGQLAFTLAKALNDSRGSAYEYRELVKELRSFDQALLQVVALWQNYESSPELDRVCASAKTAVQDCHSHLLAFKDKIDKKYETSLSSSDTKNWLRCTPKKMLWVKEKEDIEALRKRLETNSEAIIMLTLVAVGTSIKLDNTKQEQRIQAVHCLLQYAVETQNETNHQLGNITRRLDRQAETTRVLLDNVQSGLGTLTQVRTIVVGMYSMLSTLHHMTSQQGTFPSGVNSCWKQAPITLEDALGDLVPIPLELVTSWEMFHTVLGGHFANRRGHRKVLKGEYAIQDHQSGKILDPREHWKLSVQPGQKLNMSMTFKWNEPSLESCSTCCSSPETTASIDIRCANPKCKVWFRRLSTLEEDRVPTQTIIHRPGDGSDMSRWTGPSTTAVTGANQTSTAEYSNEDDISSFRRVELVLDKRPNCLRIVERYSLCGCLYYKHPVQHCAGGCGENGKCVVREKTVLVGLACAQHLRRL